MVARVGLQQADAGGRAGRAVLLPAALLADAMPRRNSTTSSASGGGEDIGSDRRQRYHLGELLAEQLVEDLLARVRTRSEPLSSLRHEDWVEQRLHGVVGEDEHVQQGTHA